MKYIISILIILLNASSFCSYSMSVNYKLLDQELSKRDQYLSEKLGRIDSLQKLLDKSSTEKQELDLTKLILEEYLLLHADSAIFYSKMAETKAEELGENESLSEIHVSQSVIYAISGFFEEAERKLQSIDPSLLSDRVKLIYFEQYVRFYNWLLAFGTTHDFQETHQKMEACADSVVALLPNDSGKGLFWQAEVCKYHGNYEAAERFYKEALDKLDMNERYYASAACALAFIYQDQKRYDECEEWFIKSAISDQRCVIKENYALQAISDFLVNVRGDEKRANTYIGYALSDAIYYNNRLRLTEIAKKFPNVVYRYQESEKLTINRMSTILVVICLLVLGLAVAIWLSFKQTRRLRKSQKTVRAMYQELNGLNKQLKLTNSKREKYASLFIELSASYMDKYTNLIKTIERKVKAKQTDDLLATLHANRVSDTDAKEFFINFDSAFLELYPTFVTEFNNLLKPEYRIEPKKGEILSGELRIFALIRLGINDTQQLSTLLFYSTRTIYNYRSVIKQHAISPEEFDVQVMQICSIR